jgi:hypothetical protein
MIRVDLLDRETQYFGHVEAGCCAAELAESRYQNDPEGLVFAWTSGTATVVAGEWHWDPALAMDRRLSPVHSYPSVRVDQIEHTGTARLCGDCVFGRRRIG